VRVNCQPKLCVVSMLAPGFYRLQVNVAAAILLNDEFQRRKSRLRHCPSTSAGSCPQAVCLLLISDTLAKATAAIACRPNYCPAPTESWVVISSPFISRSRPGIHPILYSGRAGRSGIGSGAYPHSYRPLVTLAQNAGLRDLSRPLAASGIRCRLCPSEAAPDL